MTTFVASVILFSTLTSTGLSQTIDLAVSSCTTLETEFTVVNGVAGGKAYIEGTTNASCVTDLFGNASDVLQLTFNPCGVTPTYLTSSNTLEFWVVVTETAYSNTNTDSRFHIRCLFQESTSNVDIQVEAETADKAGKEKKHNNIPQAVISLCRVQADGSCDTVSYSNLVVMGETLKLRFDLEPQLPEYELRVDECFFEAKDKQTAVSVSSIDLLDPTTHCAIYPVFQDFMHATDQMTSDAGNLFDTPYAENTFEAFIPLTVSRALALVNLDLVIGCKVSVCFRSSDCTLPTCGGGRRKRESGSAGHTGNTTKAWLYEGFRMQFHKDENVLKHPDDTNDDFIDVQPGTNDICLDKLEFWTILLSLLFILLCICLGFCCFFLYTRRNRQNKHDKSIYMTEDMSPSVTKTTSVATIESSRSDLPRLLPRLVPASLNRKQPFTSA